MDAVRVYKVSAQAMEQRWWALPLDVALHIVPQLDIVDISRAALVCTGWRNVFLCDSAYAPHAVLASARHSY